ncbi:hypothetical protein PACTADRAFT_52057 [Pachysolen tannophilus NRRL Y-2460]|uniref:Tyrosine specific protein phosphatases domain-containing protein n=1 Tax=Pachysolen tannophilus NRRL Y-2460 TaxID=669874 RepID=A0A1E4TNZ8_PACTA|nr:hypothetical protein PACTADRAFT_52057 [Pachysolen tannophilus NRRL Y-2460]
MSDYQQLSSELQDEEDIVDSSTRYLNDKNTTISLKNLTFLQSLETVKIINFKTKFYNYLLLLYKRFFQNELLSDFEKIVLAEPNDCSLVSKYSKIEKFDLSKVPALSINDIYLSTLSIPHPLRVHVDRSTNINREQVLENLQKLNDLPLVIVLHGLGGQMSQFEQLLALFSQCSDIFSLDLPGFGNSRKRGNLKEDGQSLTKITKEDQQKIADSIKKMNWDDFKTDNLVDLLIHIINIKRGKRNVILIGHSMGSHLAIKILNKLPKNTVESLILLSPPKIGEKIGKKPFILRLLSWSSRAFDCWRTWDRIGGLDSKSVNRQIYNCDISNIFKKLKQFRWNLDIKSNILMRYIYGFKGVIQQELIESISKVNDVKNKSFSKILIVCGENDLVTPFKISLDIVKLLQKNDFNPTLEKISSCGHGLLLDKPEIISGLILNFVEELNYLNINLPWCLKVKALISGDKWGLKNELKWQRIVSVSKQITNPTTLEKSPLVAMKALRESDPIHNPQNLEKDYPNLIAIVDISSDLPSYNPGNFRRIKYHKMPTVSKVIPDSTNIRNFINLIQEILKKDNLNADGSIKVKDNPLIAVHCHYGFNRTGFLICCYLIEIMGWPVEDAIRGFKESREPGIKHPHFIDGLYIRYEK